MFNLLRIQQGGFVKIQVCIFVLVSAYCSSVSSNERTLFQSSQNKDLKKIRHISQSILKIRAGYREDQLAALAPVKSDISELKAVMMGAALNPITTSSSLHGNAWNANPNGVVGRATTLRKSKGAVRPLKSNDGDRPDFLARAKTIIENRKNVMDKEKRCFSDCGKGSRRKNARVKEVLNKIEQRIEDIQKLPEADRRDQIIDFVGTLSAKNKVLAQDPTITTYITHYRK